MRVNFVFSEVAAGLRRNLTMTVAMILTTGIMTLLERINRTGTTVVMATHDRQIVDSMRRRVVELSSGRLARDDRRGVYGTGR